MIGDLDIIGQVAARKSMYRFAQHVMPGYFSQTPFHASYYRALDLFAHGTIRRLIVTVPPQHGKSLGSSQMLPAFILGIFPDTEIAIASYAFTLASRFNRRVQRTIELPEYRQIFPETRIKSTADKDDPSIVQTAERFEVANHTGGVLSVGRGGGLTGNKVDVMIIDDLYKDAAEGNSPIIRDSTFDWYTSVVKTRLHNDSRELMVFTRWHEDDLIGRIAGAEEVRILSDFADIEPGYTGWYHLNFDALKESDPTPIDAREPGAPLWPERHSAELLSEKRALDHHTFECMYQGKPASRDSYLYGDYFATYIGHPLEPIKSANYTDTADTGRDKLCSICYQVGKDGRVYVTDVLYTDEPMEKTEPATAAMLERNNTRIAYIESNNGGRGFARAVGAKFPTVKIEAFSQRGNKESRILTNSATVMHSVVMPFDWYLRWPELYRDLTTYKRDFKANRNDDAPDVLTGIVEREVLKPRASGVKRFGKT